MTTIDIINTGSLNRWSFCSENTVYRPTSKPRMRLPVITSTQLGQDYHSWLYWYAKQSIVAMCLPAFRAAKTWLRPDHQPSVKPWSGIEMTRKRTRESLQQQRLWAMSDLWQKRLCQKPKPYVLRFSASWCVVRVPIMQRKFTIVASSVWWICCYRWSGYGGRIWVTYSVVRLG